MIVGRSVELEAIRRCLDGIATGPIGLVIDGPAGIGKSTLWLEAIARAEERGIRVLRARPSEAEGHMSYAVVADLIDAIFDEVGDALPGPQRRALSTALLRAEPDGSTDVRIVGTALVGIFAVLAGRSQVVVAIDDVQWLDPASHEVLEFALRRLAGPIGIILTRRTTGRADPPLRLDQVLPVGRLELIIPGPMSLAAIHHLARNRLDRTLPRTILSRIVTESEGNPFYALELAKVWTVGAARAADEVTGGGAIAMPGSIRDVVARRVQALPEAARQVVAIAAGMGRPRRSVITAIVGDRDATEGIADAVAAGVLIVSGDALRFEHPLLASAVEEGLSEQARRAVHKQLAANAEDLEEQGRHLAAAGTGPDAAVADVVEAGARLAARRGALLSAVELWLAAGRLTPASDVAARMSRLVGLAAVLLLNGDPPAARANAEQALALDGGGRWRIDALLVLADVAWAEGTLDEAAARLAAAAAATHDPAIQGRILSRLAGFNLAIDAESARACAARALELIDGAGEARLRSYALMNGFLAEVSQGRRPRPEMLAEGLRLEATTGPDATLSSVPLIWFNAIDAADLARSRHTVEDAWYRDRGDDGWQAERQSQLALVELRAGRWDLAVELIEASCGVLETYATAGAWRIAFAWRAVIDAHRGMTDRARATLEPLIADTRGRGNRQWSGLMLSALGFTEFAAGHPVAADEALVAMRTEFDAIGFREAVGDRSEAYHVEALLSLGERRRAGEVLGRLEERSTVFPRPWITVALPRARALVLAAGGDIAAALATIGDVDPDAARRLPFEAAWTGLIEGQLRRRVGQRRAAASVLEQSLAVFESLGAPVWAARARSELRRVGLRHVAADELTMTERRIAELAGSGLTNREVAEQAFVSPKTVEANLARVYRKLGIRSRAELGRRMAGERGGPQT